MRIFVWIIVLLVSLYSCSSKNSNQDIQNKKVITVSIIPEKTFVEKIAGDEFDINILIPPGASPADYTLLPSQLRDIVNSEVWFRIGYIGFEYAWKEKIEQTNPNMKVIDLSEGVDLISENNEQNSDHEHVNGVDPHIWLSPSNVKQIARRIADELSKLNPEKEKIYNSNYIKFAEEIDQIDLEIRSALKDYKGRKIFVFHPSLTYFAKDYGIEQYSLEEGGKEPTPRHMAEIVSLAKSENVTAIYIQSEFALDNARVFADEIGGEVIQINPLDPMWKENLLLITKTLTDNF